MQHPKAGQNIQQALARAIDQGKFASIASLDLNVAFDVINVNLPLKRLQTIWMPINKVDLTELWLKERAFCVNAKGSNSYIRIINVGSVKGSILGPFLYLVYV